MAEKSKENAAIMAEKMKPVVEKGVKVFEETAMKAAEMTSKLVASCQGSGSGHHRVPSDDYYGVGEESKAGTGKGSMTV